VFISHSSKGNDASEKLRAALLQLAPSLEIYTSHTHRNDSTHIPKTRVFLPLLDSAYHRSQRCSNEFADACAQVCKGVTIYTPCNNMHIFMDIMFCRRTTATQLRGAHFNNARPRLTSAGMQNSRYSLWMLKHIVVLITFDVWCIKS